MCSQNYSETRTFREETRRGSDGYSVPFNSRVNVPIQHSSTNLGTNSNERHLQERIRRPDTTVKWVNDSVTGSEIFRVHINIDGFSQSEVNMRVDGNKLVVYGEHVEAKQQSQTKKIIEKSFELPQGIDIKNPRVTFPTATLMQIDFLSPHSNVIIDDGRLSSKLVTNFDTSIRPLPRYTHERTSDEYTSTRRIGGGGGGSGSYQRSSSPRSYTNYDSLRSDANANRSNIYSSTNQYESRQNQSSSDRGYIGTRTDSFNNSINPTYTYRVNTDDSQLRTTNPIPSRVENSNVYEKTFSETHRETHHQRSSPTSGTQSSHEVEHRRSGSPAISRSFDEDRFRTGLSLGTSSIRPSSSHNVEVREFSRRVGNNGISDGGERSLFSKDFNEDAFYRSAFRPQVFTDDRGRNCIEMKLDVHNYQPSEVKVSVNGNDLVVQAEHNDDRPPTSSTRAYFYKQITLPSNTDLNTLSSQYYPDGSLHIIAKLSNAQASIRYN